jgi:hypothetical protein
MKLDDIIKHVEELERAAWRHTIEAQRLYSAIGQLEVGLKGERARAKIKAEAEKEKADA